MRHNELGLREPSIRGEVWHNHSPENGQYTHQHENGKEPHVHEDGAHWLCWWEGRTAHR